MRKLWIVMGLLSFTSFAEEKQDKVIIGRINWKETVFLSKRSPERINSQSVGLLDLPQAESRCTSFLVAPSIIMTNYHCVSAPHHLNGATYWAGHELGKIKKTRKYACRKFLGGNNELDVALVECDDKINVEGEPLTLDARKQATKAKIYVIHQNCDYYKRPKCTPSKKYSPGKLTEVAYELSHTADTLGGTSGSPLFSENTHTVVGLHHAGEGKDDWGRGTINKAVRMDKIVPYLFSYFPHLDFDVTE